MGSTETATGHDIAADTTATVTDDQTDRAADGSASSHRSRSPSSAAGDPPDIAHAVATSPLSRRTRSGRTQGGFYLRRSLELRPCQAVPRPRHALPRRRCARAGKCRQVQVLASTDVPQATAMVVNITEVNGTAASLLTVYSSQGAEADCLEPELCGSHRHRQPRHRHHGRLRLHRHLQRARHVNVLVDLEGYFEPEASTDDDGLFHPIAPYRVCDTRHPSPTPFCSTHGAMGPETSMAVNVTGASQIPSDGTAGSVVVNLTGVAGSASTYLSLFPTNSSGGCPVHRDRMHRASRRSTSRRERFRPIG